ncbi:MAG: glutamate racemase [Rikenellaceae bacterium]|nr:glutamate racemase [Rikenellaceae bacterium]MBO5399045.1 glutamate racemase [Alistipes sp.]MDO5487309.1 glutamate racemase [Rikenellaceae bacterium]
MNNNPIGVYDSGFGGLSVWRELHRALPRESLIYLGDGKNCPYGNKTEEQIRELAERAVGDLVERGCKMVVVACNTATAAAIEYLRERFSHLPIVGLEPAVKPACAMTRSKVVGVIATERSLVGRKFLSTLERYGEGVEVLKVVGEGFVEAVEADAEQEPRTEELVRRVVEPIIERGADVIVLGCTHYPFLGDVIRRVVGDREVAVIDSGEAVEKRVESLLDKFSLRCAEDNVPRLEFLSYADEEYRARLEHKALR